MSTLPASGKSGGHTPESEYVTLQCVCLMPLYSRGEGRAPLPFPLSGGVGPLPVSPCGEGLDPSHFVHACVHARFCLCCGMTCLCMQRLLVTCNTWLKRSLIDFSCINDYALAWGLSALALQKVSSYLGSHRPYWFTASTAVNSTW